MHLEKFLLSALLTRPLLSHACLFAPGYKPFKPAVASFQAKLDGDRIAPLPAPRVGAIRLRRGTASPGSSCDDAGSLVLELHWPEFSVYKLKDIGFYFRVVGGKQPDRIFPRGPVTGTIDGRTARFFFAWIDGHPSAQTPLKLDVEVFAVNKARRTGGVRRFRIDEAVHKADLAESLPGTEYRAARTKIIAAGWQPDYRKATMEWNRLLQEWYPELHDCASDRPVCAMFFRREQGSCLKVVVRGEVPALYWVDHVARECDEAG